MPHHHHPCLLYPHWIPPHSSYLFPRPHTPHYNYRDNKESKHMEGLIPFVYRAIMQPKNDDAPSSYVRLPTGDSGRFQSSHINVFRSDHGRSSASPLPSSTTHRPNIGSSMLEFSHQAVM
ncbi:unnamed protein product [Lactuca virosa]|uniref:Uncharacterized protein n=1 Tax=Lactuca virosa TaxID=75947 RepID=A0AAU9NNK6_9ASTR|nr:unnamed protein product [Lactuca virosa]